MCFFLFKIFNSSFYINGETYKTLPNKIILTKKWLSKLFGKETKDYFVNFFEKFNRLELNDTEKAIMFPYILTKHSIFAFFLFVFISSGDLHKTALN